MNLLPHLYHPILNCADVCFTEGASSTMLTTVSEPALSTPVMTAETTASPAAATTQTTAFTTPAVSTALPNYLIVFDIILSYQIGLACYVLMCRSEITHSVVP